MNAVFQDSFIKSRIKIQLTTDSLDSILVFAESHILLFGVMHKAWISPMISWTDSIALHEILTDFQFGSLQCRFDWRSFSYQFCQILNRFWENKICKLQPGAFTKKLCLQYEMVCKFCLNLPSRKEWNIVLVLASNYTMSCGKMYACIFQQSKIRKT